MQTLIIVVHVIAALAIVGLVLLQQVAELMPALLLVPALPRLFLVRLGR